MTYKNGIGRPSKVDQKTILRLSDAIQHSATVADACRYAGISRTTYYYHYNHEKVFAERMDTAKASQFRLLTFLTFL